MLQLVAGLMGDSPGANRMPGLDICLPGVQYRSDFMFKGPGLLPVLYTFRRCPYAIRARMALAYAGIKYELREVVLRDKPPSMLELSAKGTVPVLQLEGNVIDESLEVMDWALGLNDPDDWKAVDLRMQSELVSQCDDEFKHWLDRYKYADRYPERSAEYYRQQGEVFLQILEAQLASADAGAYLFGSAVRFADVAIFPFVRQFAFVDKTWFDDAPYPLLQRWG